MPPGAKAAEQHDVTFELRNLGAVQDPACAMGRLTFDLVSPTGQPLGSGSSCVRLVPGCEEGVVEGCEQVVRSSRSFSFSGGTVFVEATLRETGIAPLVVDQRISGQVVGGAGAYEGVKGRISGGGTFDFSTFAQDLL